MLRCGHNYDGAFGVFVRRFTDCSEMFGSMDWISIVQFGIIVVGFCKTVINCGMRV